MRQTSILAGLESQRCANESDGHDLYCHLQDLKIQLPTIMERLDMLSVSTSKTAERPILIRLLQLCSSLNAQLLAWKEKLEKQGHNQLYWMVPSVANNPADDPIFGRVFPVAFQFPSLRIAQLLLLYWSTLILLYRTIQDIQKRLKWQVSDDPAWEHSFGLQDSDWNEVCSDHRRPSHRRIALLANDICQSLEYCYHHTNGTHGPQLTVFPLWVVQNFYRSQLDKGRELAWCSELGNMTAPDSRFDLYFMTLSEGG
jgi:hypothetical protein